MTDASWSINYEFYNSIINEKVRLIRDDYLLMISNTSSEPISDDEESPMNALEQDVAEAEMIDVPVIQKREYE